MDELREFLKTAANLKPTERQLKWYDREFYAFVHFSPNTYTGLEWGLGNEDERIFNPTELDCDQWVEAIKSAGMKGMIDVYKRQVIHSSQPHKPPFKPLQLIRAYPAPRVRALPARV